MALPPITSSNLSFNNQQAVERNQDDRAQQQPSEIEEIQTQPVDRADRGTTAEPLEATDETARSENDARLQQERTNEQNVIAQQDDNSAESNLGNQLDITV